MTFRATILAAAILAASPAVAQELGERTASPEDVLRALGSQDDEEAAVAAASAHPLGTIENPVRVGGPEGERAYIARLRCADGAMPKVGERASAGPGAFGTIVAVYPLDCAAAAPGKAELVLDMYHEEHRETRAPAGFTLAP